MELKRMQLYLEPHQHRALKREARERALSLSKLLRQIIDEHLAHRPRSSKPTKAQYLAIVGLGRSGRKDVAVHHDQHLGEILHP